MAKNKRLIQRFLSIQQSGGSTTLPDTISDDFASGFNARWQQAGSAWAVSGGAAICTPTLGAELFLNGTFATDTNWSKGTGWTISGGVANKAAGTAGSMSQAIATIGMFHKITCDLTVTASTFATVFGNTTNIGKTFSTTQSVVSTRWAIATTLGWRGLTATSAGSIDNASAKAITTSDMMATISGLKNAANISAAVTVGQDTPAGVVGWLDSQSSPLNYIACFTNGETLTLIKVVAGTITSLINSAITYSAGATITLKGTRSGADLLLTAHYNGSQVGTQQTVSDAAIVDNRRHGMFSTSELNSLDNFAVTAYA